MCSFDVAGFKSNVHFRSVSPALVIRTRGCSLSMRCRMPDLVMSDCGCFLANHHSIVGLVLRCSAHDVFSARLTPLCALWPYKLWRCDGTGAQCVQKSCERSLRVVADSCLRHWLPVSSDGLRGWWRGKWRHRKSLFFRGPHDLLTQRR